MIITIFGKSIKIGKNLNQIDMFAGAEKEFAPGDRRRLEVTNGGKLRWKNADEEGSGKIKVESGKPTYQDEMQNKYENAKKNLNIDDDLELLNELEKRLKEIPGPNMNRVMKDDKEAEKLKTRNRHEEVIRFIKKKNNFEDKPNRDQLYYESEDTEWLKKRNSAIASRILDGKATDRELKINETILEELGKREKKKSDRPSGKSDDKIDYAQKLINTVQTSKTFDDFLKNIRISEFPNEFFKNGLGLGDDTAQNIKKLKDYYSKQKATHKEERKKDKEETDRAIAEFHVDEIERIALQQNAEYEKKIADRPRVETVKNPVKGEPDLVKKEPWEMTEREYVNAHFEKPEIKLAMRNPVRGKGILEATIQTVDAQKAEEHKALIQQAIKQGKPVPPEVLKDYPELRKETSKSIIKSLFKAFGKQISMFGEKPYQKEGQTKEGRGGTLKLTRDKSGKGAHWKLANKDQSAVGSKQSAVGSGQSAEKQTGGKIITPANAFELLQDKIGNSVLLQDNEGNLLGEGALQLVNENSEGNYSIFVKEANGFDSVVPIPKNQAVVQKEDEINFKFADKKIVISTKEKSKLPSKPVEMEKAEENAKHARNLEKMRNYNEWQKQADSYARTANGQKDWFFGDLEIAADAEGLEFGVKNRIIKKSDTLFKEIKRNATRDDKAEIFSALVGAFEVKSGAKAKAVISNLKKKGYEISADQLDQLKDKDTFFTRVKISKGENDPLPKELQFATGEYALAFEECTKKPNPLRETEMSLGLKIAAERVPEFNTIKKQLFNQAGEGLGQMWITGGLPGSGKSTTLGGEFYKNKVLIDPDSIKYMLAEERGISKKDVDLRPWELHEESSVIAKHLVREAIREKKDIIYDISMKGTANLNDLLYMVNSDTFQANAEFIHLPIEKGIERDKARGEKGGRSIGADLYKKLFGDYPTHKAFFELKDSFDNFRVYDNSAPLGEGAKLFYVKNDGQEKILHPEIHEEFRKIGLSKMGKSLYLKYQRKKLLKALETEPKPVESAIGGGNTQELPQSEKLKKLLDFPMRGIDREIDPEQDFFDLGLLKMHGLIDENMNLTPEGEQKYQSQFGNKFSNMNGEENEIEKVVNPIVNIADETGGGKKPAIKAFGKEFKKGK